MKILLGFVLAIGIGILCRLAGVPLPAPPVLIGALLVVAMSTGYTLTDRFARHREAANRVHCGGPTGEPAKQRDSAT
jgi:XapX domain-containing protein